ncbi:MAG: SMP-30/gluconolactonase/LRE family protein [Acidobacteriia bacterium]|nr:SMP-30/gluconolactonase/LRE family protein [Terriglobia bacterium]
MTTSPVTVIADYGDRCGECPVWDPSQGVLEWIDQVGQKFYRLNWTSRQHTIVTGEVAMNGFRPNRSAGYVIATSQGIWHWDGHHGPTAIVTEIGGRPCQVNDCVADSRGRFLTASYFYNPADKYELGSLIRVDTDGKASILDEGFHLSNGLGFSPDDRILYFADSAARRIYSYDYDVHTGSASNRRVFVQVPLEEGLPDGLAVDAEGFVWSAQWYGSCVVRYDPDGKVERRVTTPAKQTSSLAFGGADLTDIFVTSAAQSEAMPIMPPGYDPNTGNFGGALYHFNLGIPGLRQHQADLELPLAPRSTT